MNAVARHPARSIWAGLGAALLAGCAPSYSPDTYASHAVQQANRVDQGVLIGVRLVSVSADITNGSITGSAAGGIAGSQTATGVVAAFGALGGAVVGGLAGTALAHTMGDVHAYEYIVRKDDGGLLSVTQQDHAPLAVGAHVLVIAGVQARVLPDYTVALTPPPPPGPVEVAPHPSAVISESLPPLQLTQPAAP